MTTEQQKAKEQAAVMLAFADGKKIECKRKSSDRWIRIHDLVTPYWDWSEQDYRIATTPEPQLPPIPDGYELVIDSRMSDGPFLYARENDKNWHQDIDIRYSGWSICRPILKPKMPSGVFWVRTTDCGITAHLVTDIISPDYLRLSNNTTYSIKLCIERGYEWSHDRVTWHKFGGEK